MHASILQGGILVAADVGLRKYIASVYTCGSFHLETVWTCHPTVYRWET